MNACSVCGSQPPQDRTYRNAPNVIARAAEGQHPQHFLTEQQQHLRILRVLSSPWALEFLGLLNSGELVPWVICILVSASWCPWRQLRCSGGSSVVLRLVDVRFGSCLQCWHNDAVTSCSPAKHQTAHCCPCNAVTKATAHNMLNLLSAAHSRSLELTTSAKLHHDQRHCKVCSSKQHAPLATGCCSSGSCGVAAGSSSGSGC